MKSRYRVNIVRKVDLEGRWSGRDWSGWLLSMVMPWSAMFPQPIIVRKDSTSGIEEIGCMIATSPGLYLTQFKSKEVRASSFWNLR